LRCSFCHRTKQQVEVLINSTDQGALICNDCVKVCSQILTDRSKTQTPKAPSVFLDWMSGRIWKSSRAEEIPMQGILERRLDE
jgi:ATP-dependent protease Clp ATPase subunit